MPSPSRFETATARAMRRLLVAAVALAVVVGVVLAVLVSPLIGVVVVLLGGVGAALGVRSLVDGAQRRVLSSVGARPVASEDLAAWHNALEGIALQTGVEPPEVLVLDVPGANAMGAAPPRGGRAAVVVTTAMVEGSRPLETEVLAAELLCRVRDGSAALATLAASLPGWLRAVAGLSDAEVASVLGDQRASHADIEAVGVTRYPPGLISALTRMEDRGTTVAVDPCTAALWVAPAVGPEGLDPRIDATANQPLGYRIAVLREL